MSVCYGHYGHSKIRNEAFWSLCWGGWHASGQKSGSERPPTTQRPRGPVVRLASYREDSLGGVEVPPRGRFAGGGAHSKQVARRDDS